MNFRSYPSAHRADEEFSSSARCVCSLRGGSPGDLHARIVFEVPANLDRKQREALEAFQKACTPSTYPERQRFEQKTRVFFAHKEKLGK